MAIRHILVHVEPGETGERRLRYSLSLARSYEARLTGISVRPSPNAVAFSVMGDGQAYAALSEACEETCLKARTLFEKTTAGSGVVVDWQEGNGVPAQVIAAEAACADLLILGKNNQDDPSGPLYDVRPADVVLACGRPVLIAPNRPPEEFHARRVLLAWKSGAQAARAAHDALPLMVGAEEVIVAEIVSNGSTFDYEVSGDMMADHLRMHDLKVAAIRIGQSGDAGDLLIGAAQSRACDLIVAGAFGHSRTREWVLGGVTRTLLDAETPPLLLSH
jgi:nucleotide-binding universal stress UspA family protein